MRSYIKVFILVSIAASVKAQQHLPNSIAQALKNASNDSLRYQENHDAYLYFEEANRDSSLYYTEKCLSLSRKDDKKLATARGLASKGYLLTGKGEYAEALKNLLQALAIAEDPKNASNDWFTDNRSYTGQRFSPEQTRLFVLALTHHMYAILMRTTQNVPQQIFHFREAGRLAKQINSIQRVMLADMNLGSAYVSVNKTDSALIFLNEARQIMLKTGQKKYLGFVLMNLGDIELKKGDLNKGKYDYYDAVSLALEQNNQTTLTLLYMKLTDVYLGVKQKDSSLYFAKKAFETFSALGILSGETINIGTAYQKLYESYKLRGQLDSAFKYAGLALTVKDKIHTTQVGQLSRFQSLSLKEQLRLQNLEKERLAYQSRARIYAFAGTILTFLIIGFILWRNNKKQKHINVLLSEQKEEISAQRDDLEDKNRNLAIEAALERVRAKTMAMHSSQDVADTVAARPGTTK